MLRPLFRGSHGGVPASGIGYTIFFYNPNIHPEREYLLRKEENIRFAEKHGVSFVDADYDTDNWFARAKGMEWKPERGVRCTMCFERTALCLRARLPSDQQFGGHLALEEHATDQQLRAALRRQVP